MENSSCCAPWEAAVGQVSLPSTDFGLDSTAFGDRGLSSILEVVPLEFSLEGGENRFVVKDRLLSDPLGLSSIGTEEDEIGSFSPLSENN